LPSTLSNYSIVLPVVVVPPPSLLQPSSNDTNTNTNSGSMGNGGVMTLSATTSSWKESNEPTTSTNSPSPVPIGVHFLQYKQSNTDTSHQTTTNNNNNNKYDGIYFHHGFGASSLSWLPVLPTLVHRLGKNNGKSIGIAHDAPGFGFTDRPDGDDIISGRRGGLYQYGTENNVGIGLALLQQSLLEEEGNNAGDGSGSSGATTTAGGDGTEAKSIAIFGHSMGSKAALLMALHCHSHTQLQLRPNLVVLVAPALEGLSLPSKNGGNDSRKRKMMSRRRSKESTKGWLTILLHRVWVTWRKMFLDYPFQYGLRRLVG
jgi:pimeloyl-ACP methyl ester carboxylesterase